MENKPLILDGKKVANELFSKLPNMQGKELAIITIGDDDASKVYVRNKIKDAERVGLVGKNYKFNISEFTDISLLASALKIMIWKLNKDDNVIGIMIQQPYPEELKSYNLEYYILESKDVDGLSHYNMCQTLLGRQPKHYPATPKGIIKLLDYYNIPIEGKNVVIIGRSDIVGKPLAAMMLARNANPVVCHSKTSKENLNFYLQNSDIIISAVGKPHFISSKNFIVGTTNYLGGGIHNTYSINMPVIIDVGINRDENSKLCGDVDFDNVYPYVSAITPVPGGVGPMTRWALIDNCCKTIVK